MRSKLESQKPQPSHLIFSPKNANLVQSYFYAPGMWGAWGTVWIPLAFTAWSYTSPRTVDPKAIPSLGQRVFPSPHSSFIPRPRTARTVQDSFRYQMSCWQNHLLPSYYLVLLLNHSIYTILFTKNFFPREAPAPLNNLFAYMSE